MDDVLQNIIRKTLTKAEEAASCGEIPVAAAVFDQKTGEILALCANRTERDHDPTAHAEILAVRQACAQKGTPRLPEYALYVTLEPCPMCAAAISFARLNRVYFGAYDPKGGGIEHGCRLYQTAKNLFKPEVYGGFAEKESESLLKRFFDTVRKEKP